MTQPTTTSGPVVIAAATIMDGLVLRWYDGTNAAEYSPPILSASRNGVSVHTTYLHEVPAGWLEDAQRAYELLRGRRDDQAAAEMATHRRTGLFGPPEPIQRPASTVESTPDGEDQ